MAESVDAIVVGGRCSGAAAAIALARAGRRVVVLDRARFGSDTLSTHLLFPAGLAEVQALGALDRVKEIGYPEHREALVGGAGVTAQASYSAYDGVGHGACIRRPGFDAALADTAREAGADLRERTAVTGLIWRGGRVTGVRFEGRDGTSGVLRAPLVIGADGRRSLVAREVGADTPHRRSKNRRACYFAYIEDERTGDDRHVAAQWREGRELGTAFPCDDGLLLVLLMPPLDRSGEFKTDMEGEYRRTIAAIPGLAERVGGGRIATKVRSATDTTAYFRHSAGHGWALAGDAGHFKDPVTAQGMRDAMRFGRLLGEAAAPVLEDVVALDRAVAAWQHRRDGECLETYQWTNVLARAEAITPLEHELYRDVAASPERTRELLDVFSRLRRPAEVLTAGRALRYTARAFCRPGVDRREVIRTTSRDARTTVRDAAERQFPRGIVSRRSPAGTARA
ncbi:MAG: NAD(P)/FAD-dependent oxidoreductase [Baekduia sp.]